MWLWVRLGWRLSWEDLWLSCSKTCLRRWCYLTLMGQLGGNADWLWCHDPRYWRYGDSGCNMRQRRLDLCLEGSSRLDKIRLSDTRWGHDPRVELRCRVTSLGLSLVGIHHIGKLLGYHWGRLSCTSLGYHLWRCWGDSDRNHRFLHVSSTNNLLGRDIGERSGLSESLWWALHGLWTGVVLAWRLIGL